MKEKRPRGAPKGNRNARKHGFYSQVLDETQQLHLDRALEVEGLDEEIGILRVKLLSLIENHPDRFDQLLEEQKIQSSVKDDIRS
jgi:hypothetical protein